MSLTALIQHIRVLKEQKLETVKNLNRDQIYLYLRCLILNNNFDNFLLRQVACSESTSLYLIFVSFK